MNCAENKAAEGFFVGIDSDGTVFDTMTVKHRDCFIPVMIKQWGLEKISRSVFEVAERINLFSHERGINRFPSLVRVFDDLKDIYSDDFPIKEYEALREFVSSGCPMSNDGLKRFMETHTDGILNETLEWSLESDKAFSRAAEKITPFANAVSAIEKIKDHADIWVISSASGKGLSSDFERCGISKNVKKIMGQEYGSKLEQLRCAKNTGYDGKRSVMIGDALGDLKAAQEAGMFFYPIIAGKEELCWKKFSEKYFDLFLNDGYSEVQDTLISEFTVTLK